MTVKIVNDRHPDAVKRTVCRKCAAELEYTLADTYKETIRDYGGGSDTYTMLRCPRCSHEIVVTNH